MSVLYAESSAVLAWLLAESTGKAVDRELSRADQVVTSLLTLVECGRGLARARAMRRVKPAEEIAALRQLDQAAATWSVLDISDRVAARARGSFPQEPVRTLDAIHLATAEVFAASMGTLRVLALDERVRANAAKLGMKVLPA